MPFDVMRVAVFVCAGTCIIFLCVVSRLRVAHLVTTRRWSRTNGNLSEARRSRATVLAVRDALPSTIYRPEWSTFATLFGSMA